MNRDSVAGKLIGELGRMRMRFNMEPSCIYIGRCELYELRKSCSHDGLLEPSAKGLTGVEAVFMGVEVVVVEKESHLGVGINTGAGL